MLVLGSVRLAPLSRQKGEEVHTSCGARRVQQLPALHAFHTAPSAAGPLFSWEQRTGRQPSLPVPENRRFRGKGGRVIGPFHIAREAAVTCLEGFSGHKAALRPLRFFASFCVAGGRSWGVERHPWSLPSRRQAYTPPPSMATKSVPQ